MGIWGCRWKVRAETNLHPSDTRFPRAFNTWRWRISRMVTSRARPCSPAGRSSTSAILTSIGGVWGPCSRSRIFATSQPRIGRALASPGLSGAEKSRKVNLDFCCNIDIFGLSSRTETVLGWWPRDMLIGVDKEQEGCGVSQSTGTMVYFWVL